MAFEPIK